MFGEMSAFYYVGFENGSTALTKRFSNAVRIDVYRNNGECYEHTVNYREIMTLRKRKRGGQSDWKRF